MNTWNASNYLKFEIERTLPATDLVNRVKTFANPMKILDLGCGPGNSTAQLKKAFPNAYILGVDSSQNMIDTAKAAYSDIEFAIFDGTNELSKLGTDFDLVFSNACIQWIPDHDKLILNMLSCLRKAGMIAIQTPMNYEEPIHKIITRTAESQKWVSKFSSPQIFYNLRPEEYFDILTEYAESFQMWTTTFFHTLENHQAIMDWYKSTGLRPYLDQLDDCDKAAFEQEIYNALVEEYTVQKNGEIIFRFPRFFFTANK